MAKAGQGQTLNDRLNAARYAIAGQGLARVVCKATTEEVLGPKKKHLDYLLQCTHEPNVSIPQLAIYLIDRTAHSSWVVVFKALITVHYLMCYGNERFTQYLASSNCTFQLNNFLDRSNLKGYDMSTYIKRYSKYINEKALSYRIVAFDFVKIRRGKEDGFLRTMPSEKLLKSLVVLQSQIDALLEFDCPANHLTNGVINVAFMLLFRDLIRLFACYNDGIINLLEKFFDMNKKQCRDALEIYKKFLVRMDRVAEFLKTAENVGVEKGEIPDLTKAPSSLLEALEQHLLALEGNKKGVKSSKDAQSTAQGANSNSPVTLTEDQPTEGVKDQLVKKALEEEAQILNQLKEKHVQDQTKKSYNPFLSSPTETKPDVTSSPSKLSSDILDIFGTSETSSVATPIPSLPSTTAVPTKASDDLLIAFTGESNAQPPPGHEPLVPWMVPLVPVPPQTSPFAGMNISQLNLPLAYIEAVRQQQAVSSTAGTATTTSGGPVINKDANKKKSAFEDLDFAMRSQMLKGKEEQPVKAGSRGLATGIGNFS